jgi:hypothetical protein
VAAVNDPIALFVQVGEELFPVGRASTVAALVDALRSKPGIEIDDRQLAEVAKVATMRARRLLELAKGRRS